MNPQTDIMKNVLDILKERPFIWVVLFLGCSLLLFSSLLEFLGSNLVPANVIAFIRIIIGIVWIISGVAILCKLIMYLYGKIEFCIKRKLSQDKNFKKIANLSYEEKLLLFIAVKLDMPIVPVPDDNKIALMLVVKQVLSEPNFILPRTSLEERSFTIPEDIWKVLSSKPNIAVIFKDILSKNEEDLKKEWARLIPGIKFNSN
jgi:hypothetical protein